MLRDYLSTYPQAETIPRHAFGSEKRLEQPRHSSQFHAYTAIRNADSNVSSSFFEVSG
jgi:hypothetical protein